jgi:hypothetical protein
VTHTIELVDASHLSSAGTNEFYKSEWHLVPNRLLDGTFARCERGTAAASSSEIMQLRQSVGVGIPQTRVG